MASFWWLPQILPFSEIFPLLLRGPGKFTELLVFLVCFLCHVILVPFGLSLGWSCSLGHGRVSRPFGLTEALKWRSWAAPGCPEPPFWAALSLGRVQAVKRGLAPLIWPSRNIPFESVPLAGGCQSLGVCSLHPRGYRCWCPLVRCIPGERA